MKTGKTRFKIINKWFRKPLVVLQVQHKNSYVDPFSTTRFKTTSDRLTWHYATTEDLLDLSGVNPSSFMETIKNEK